MIYIGVKLSIFTNTHHSPGDDADVAGFNNMGTNFKFDMIVIMLSFLIGVFSESFLAQACSSTEMLYNIANSTINIAILRRL